MVREIDVETFAAERDGGVPLVDVRSPEEYAAGHVPGAVNVPLEQLVAEPARFAGQELHVICQAGGRSMKAAQALAAAGAKPASVAGGTGEWIRTGRPVDTGPH